MTPKEKADELCRKMLYKIEWNAQPSTIKGIAKQCALIAVDEIINVLPHHEYLEDRDEYHENRERLYYQEVKQEIEKL